MREITFVIPGRIGGKGRHRSFLRDGKVLHVAAVKTKSQEAVVRQLCALAMRDGKIAPIRGPVSLSINMFRHTPKTWSKKKQQRMIWVTGKPDCDNIVKLISDALNGIAWLDDAQVATLQMQRLYRNGVPESVFIIIRELGADT